MSSEGIAEYGLLVVTILYAIATIGLLFSTKRLVTIEEKREINKKLGFLNMLLGEFKSNKIFLDDLDNTLTAPGRKPETWNDFFTVFIGFRDDAWTAFRTHGGLQYFSDKSLYDKIEAYYGSQYKLQKKIDNKIKWGKDREIDFPEGKCYEPEALEKFFKEIVKEIHETKIKEENVTIQNRINSLLS